MARQRTVRTASVNPRERRQVHREALNKAQAYMSGEGEERTKFQRGIMDQLGAVGYGSQQTMDRLSALQEEFAGKETAFRSELAGARAESANLAKQFMDYKASQGFTREAAPAAPVATPVAAAQPAPQRQAAPQPAPQKQTAVSVPSVYSGGGGAGVNSGAGRGTRESATALFNAVIAGQKKKKK